MTLNGKMATRTGGSRRIRNKTSPQRLHAQGGLMDNIMVGIDTGLADNLLLNARLQVSGHMLYVPGSGIAN
jgi:riboflavin biosynthesis pyrimidine reductase